MAESAPPGGPIGAPLLEELKDALLDAFPSWKALEQMVDVALGEHLERRVARGALDTVVHDLLRWARAAGRLPELVDGARRHNPGNPRLQAVAATIGPPPARGADAPAPIRAAALGELTVAAELDRCVYVAVIVDDLVAFKRRVGEHVQRWSRRPEVVRMPGRLDRGLQQRGFQADLLRGAVELGFHELIATAPMRAFAVIAPAAARSTWSARRTASLQGMMQTRFSKRAHGIARILVRAERRADSAAAVAAAWAVTPSTEPAPEVLVEAEAADALTGLSDGLARVVHHGRFGIAPVPPSLRLKLVHVFDQESRKNYGLDDVFP